MSIKKYILEECATLKSVNNKIDNFIISDKADSLEKEVLSKIKVTLDQIRTIFLDENSENSLINTLYEKLPLFYLKISDVIKPCIKNIEK